MRLARSKRGTCCWLIEDLLVQHTHIHAFDYDFPPDVLRHVGWALRRTPSWQVFASCSDQRDWLRLWQSSTRYLSACFHPHSPHQGLRWGDGALVGSECRSIRQSARQLVRITGASHLVLVSEMQSSKRVMISTQVTRVMRTVSQATTPLPLEYLSVRAKQAALAVDLALLPDSLKRLVDVSWAREWSSTSAHAPKHVDPLSVLHASKPAARVVVSVHKAQPAWLVRGRDARRGEMSPSNSRVREDRRARKAACRVHIYGRPSSSVSPSKVPVGRSTSWNDTGRELARQRKKEPTCGTTSDVEVDFGTALAPSHGRRRFAFPRQEARRLGCAFWYGAEQHP